MLPYIKDHAALLSEVIASHASDQTINVSPILHTFLHPNGDYQTGAMPTVKVRSCLSLNRISAAKDKDIIALPRLIIIPTAIRAFVDEVVLRIVDLTNEGQRSVLHNKTHSVRTYGHYHTTTTHVGACMQYVACSKLNQEVKNQSLAVQQRDFVKFLESVKSAPKTGNKNYDVILPYFYAREQIMLCLEKVVEEQE